MLNKMIEIKEALIGMDTNELMMSVTIRVFLFRAEFFGKEIPFPDGTLVQCPRRDFLAFIPLYLH